MTVKISGNQDTAYIIKKAIKKLKKNYIKKMRKNGCHISDFMIDQIMNCFPTTFTTKTASEFTKTICDIIQQYEINWQQVKIVLLTLAEDNTDGVEYEVGKSWVESMDWNKIQNAWSDYKTMLLAEMEKLREENNLTEKEYNRFVDYLKKPV